MQNPEDVQLAAMALAKAIRESLARPFGPRVGIVLGTGLSDALASLLPAAAAIPFSQLPGFPMPGVASHKGEFLVCDTGGAPALIQNGRFHIYEGYRPAEVCMGVRVMASLGCEYLIITNAAGSLNPLFPAGSLLCLSDLINHTGLSPLTGPNCDAWGERFPDMSQVFDRDLIALACDAALASQIALPRGVYIGVHGPEMETPAETRMYRQWGADAVGMSTALEVIAARHAGLKCLGLSCLTNLNLPDCMGPAPLAAVISQARKTAPKLAAIIAGVLAGLGKTPVANA